MAIAKKPTLVKSSKSTTSASAAKFVAGAASHSKAPAQPTFELVPYTFRIDAALLQRAKNAAVGQSSETGQKVTVTSFIISAIMDKVKKCEAGE